MKRGRRPGDKKTYEDEQLENKLLDEIMQQDKKNIKAAAVKVRPDVAPRTARNWGYRVMADPDVRKRMQLVEQGGLLKVHELLDNAIKVIADFLLDTKTPAKVRFEAAKLVWQRVFGAVPDTVIAIQAGPFDGEGVRDTIRDEIRAQLDVVDVEAVDE